MDKVFYQSLPVIDQAEVVVCGGGTAGAFAAIAAAREGRDVLLVEQFGMLGGSATAGLVMPVMSSHMPGNPQCSWIAEELNRRLRDLRASGLDGRSFDPVIVKVLLEDMCGEYHVRLLYHTSLADVVRDGDQISSIVVVNKDGLSRIKGRIFIDCTGDGDLSVRAGAKYTSGNPDTGLNQPMSLRYIVDGIDMLSFRDYLEELRIQTGITEDETHVSSDGTYMYGAFTPSLHSFLRPVFEAAHNAGDLTEDDLLYWQAFSIPGRYGSLAFNCPEIFEDTNGTNARHLTSAQVKGKQAILRQLAFYRKYFRGFERAYIADIAVMVGVRESREIQTEFVLTAEDILSHRKHTDMICQSNYPIDVHGKQLKNLHLKESFEDGKPWYDIPWRCLIVSGISNLLVAGRCLGADFYCQASVRVQQSARATGEAAGIGAALSLEKKMQPREIKGQEIKARMQARGARFSI